MYYAAVIIQYINFIQINNPNYIKYDNIIGNEDGNASRR